MSAKAWRISAAGALLLALGLAEWAIQESWSAEIVLGVAAVYVSVGGFAIAIIEIRRAATVSKATDKAIKTTLTGIAASRLGVTITQLRQTIEDLEQATILKDPTGARRAVNAWRNLASEVQAPLQRRFPENTTIIPALHRSIEEGREIKGPLADAKKEPLWHITTKCLGSMEIVGNQLAGLLDELTPAPPKPDE
jgi:hypothetical protein